MEYAFVLTGGIATGKSTVSKALEKSGYDVIDADKITHKILSFNTEDIKKLFGEGFIKNNKVDRKALGELIFSDELAKKKLEDFIHPLIRKKIALEAKKLDKFKRAYFIDIPLFFEKKGAYDIKNSILVYAPKNLQLQRLMKRSNLSEKEANLRISSQMDIEIKKELASFVLDNSKSPHELSSEVKRLEKWIKEKDVSIKI